MTRTFRAAILAVIAAIALTAAVPTAGAASTSSRIKKLERAVKKLSHDNKVLSGRIKDLQAGEAPQNNAIGTLLNGELLLLGVSLCYPNLVFADFTFADGAHTEMWASGDRFGPEPTLGVQPCLQDAFSAVQTSSVKARAAAPTLDQMIARARQNGLSAKPASIR